MDLRLMTAGEASRMSFAEIDGWVALALRRGLLKRVG